MFISEKEYQIFQDKKSSLKEKHRKYTEDLGDIMKTSGSFVNMTPGFDDTEAAKLRTEEQIAAIDEILDQVKVLKNVKQLAPNKVTEYSLVSGKNTETKERVAYYIQHHFEVREKETVVTPSSPIGRALLNRKIGDEIEIPLPDNPFSYKIESVEKEI